MNNPVVNKFIRASSTIEQDWKPEGYSQANPALYYSPDNSIPLNTLFKVCREDLPNDPVKPSRRKYIGRVKLVTKIKTYDDSGNMLSANTFECPIGSPTVTVAASYVCVPDFAAFKTLNSDKLRDCPQLEYLTACKGDILTLGRAFILPTTPGTKDLQWSPTTGLSNSTIPQPKLNYPDIPAQVNEFTLYKLTAGQVLSTGTFVAVSTVGCSIIYKCDDCYNPTGVLPPLE